MGAHRGSPFDCAECAPRIARGTVESQTVRLNREVRELRIRVAELELDAAKARLLSLRAGV